MLEDAPRWPAPPVAAPRSYVAVDLGASSGRVIVGTVGADRLELAEVHRFENRPVVRDDGLHWDIGQLVAQVRAGIATATSAAEIRTAGIDSWAVDYGLIGADGALLGEPFHYRDPRGARGMETVHQRIDSERLYRLNGLQQLPINTIYQLAAEPAERLENAECLLMIPDLIGYHLTGTRLTELTNASTTGLLDTARRCWSGDAAGAAGVRLSQLPAITDPGSDLGRFRPSEPDRTAVPIGLVSVASHDTASAVAAVPVTAGEIAYVSCGTWALVGVELDRPLTSDAARTGGFTNEIGLDGTVRFLRNVTGLWVLQETIREWHAAENARALTDVLAAAAARPAGGPVIDLNDQRFSAPGAMTERIRAACVRAGRPAPDTRPALVRCILDSLAATIARTVDDVAAVTGRTISAIHLVGGGARNQLLCQLLADAAHRPVLAGPAEATAIGNLLVQARADGVLRGGREALRELVIRTHPPERYLPR